MWLDSQFVNTEEYGRVRKCTEEYGRVRKSTEEYGRVRKSTHSGIDVSVGCVQAC